MKYLILLLIPLLLNTKLAAQERVLLGEHPLGKRMVFRKGDRINISYHGYLGQPEQVQNRIVAISDSVLVLGRFPVSNPDQNMRFTESQRSIRISDIQGFRPQNRNRGVYIFLYQVGAGVSTAALSYYLLREKQMNYVPALGISIATGLVFQLGQRLVFPTKIKYRSSAGWTLRAVPDRNP